MGKWGGDEILNGRLIFLEGWSLSAIIGVRFAPKAAVT